MFKWHVHSAIGRGRPATNDISRVVDGIAASLRQFSISLSRVAEDDGGNDNLRISRAQRSKEAIKEVSELAYAPSRGIDARSLAAKAPQTFTIHKVVEDFPTREGGVFRGRGGGDFRGVARGGTRGGARGGARGIGMRGRGRGGRGVRGSGRRRAGKRVRAPRTKGDDHAFKVEPLTEEELEYQAGSEQGFLKPYDPTLSAESLARHGPPVISSPRGVFESVVYKMQVATNLPGPDYEIGGNHLLRIDHGPGSMLESEEQRAITEAFSQQKGKERAERMGVPYEPELNKLGSLSKKSQERMLKEWVGGQYVFPKRSEAGDILGQVETYARRNETYLPEDTRKLQEKIKSLLPASTIKSNQRPVKSPS